MIGKNSIYITALTLLILLVGFNAFLITSDKYTIEWIYGFCDSLSWTLFSLSFYIFSLGFKEAKKLSICLQIFMVLSMSPLVNEICQVADVKSLSNYIYGIIVFLYYLTKHSIKLLTNERYKE